MKILQQSDRLSHLTKWLFREVEQSSWNIEQVALFNRVNKETVNICEFLAGTVSVISYNAVDKEYS